MNGLPEQNYTPNGRYRELEELAAELRAEGVPDGADNLPEPSGTMLSAEPWPEPEPLGGKLPPVMALTPEMLPPALRPMVEDIAARMQMPLDFPAVGLMEALAAAVGRRARMQPKERDPWAVIPNLWGGIVAEPGSKKSHVLSEVMQPLKTLEREWQEEHRAAMQEHGLALEQAEFAKSVWKDAARKAMQAGKPTPARPTEAPEEPAQRRLMAGDATMQKMHEILAANPAGILVLRDELTGWFAQLDKPGREGERTFYLEDWNGDTGHSIDTISRGSVFVPHLCLSLFGGIQPSRLRSLLAEALRGGPANDGLMQRFQLLVWPDPLREQRQYVDRERDTAAARRVEAIFRRVVLLDPENPVLFRFDAEAQELFRAWLPDLENRAAHPRESAAMRAHLAKYASLMPSLALLFALCDGGSNGMVTLAHAQMAAAWCDYLESHARRVYSAQAPTEQANAVTLGRHLAAGELGKPGATFSLRELYRKGWEGLGDAESARAALAILEEGGWVRELPAPERKNGRPKSARYVISPFLEPRHGDL